MSVDVDDLRDTVARMESRMRTARDERVRELIQAYDGLVPRFAADLRDERDELLTRGGALMLIQEVNRRGVRRPPSSSSEPRR